MLKQTEKYSSKQFIVIEGPAMSLYGDSTGKVTVEAQWPVMLDDLKELISMYESTSEPIWFQHKQMELFP